MMTSAGKPAAPRAPGSGADEGGGVMDTSLDKRIDLVLLAVKTELVMAYKKHRPLNSAHEAYAVILEELDELWAEVKADKGYSQSALNEARQVAAMACRYLLDLPR